MGVVCVEAFRFFNLGFWEKDDLLWQGRTAKTRAKPKAPVFVTDTTTFS
jgi:hypothetical protein